MKYQEGIIMYEKPEIERLHNAIFKRKSVRKYAPKALAQDALDAIAARTEKLQPFQPGTPVTFRILAEAQVKGMVSAKTPHYLAVYAANEYMAQVNAAFMLQQMDLWFSAQGLGSCWLGMPNPASDSATCGSLPFLVMLAFGAPAEETHRAEISAFKRKTAEEITSITGAESLVEALRLAPSAVNRQPWYLTGTADALRLCGRKNNLLQKMMFGDMPRMDIGIALCHLWLAAESGGVFQGFEREADPKDVPEGFEYVITVKTNA
jgi:nitroreductase